MLINQQEEKIHGCLPNSVILKRVVLEPLYTTGSVKSEITEFLKVYACQHYNKKSFSSDLFYSVVVVISSKEREIGYQIEYV